MDLIKNPHDKFFKKMFGDINITKDFLKNYLPEEILKITDLNNVTHEKESFIEKDLEEFYSDLLFRTNINGKEAYVYFLIEHKSYVDRIVAVQILEYIIKIWKLKMKKNRVPFVVPLLVYHGKQKWKVKKNLIDLVEDVNEFPKGVLKYIPNFEYIIYDLSSLTNYEIKGKAILRIIMKVLVNVINDSENITSIISEAGKVIEQISEKNKGTEYFEVFIRYIMSVKPDLDINDIYEAVKSDSHERSEIIMTIAEKLINEGIEKGIEKGKLETAIELRKLGSDFEFISKATKIPVSKLKELFNEKKDK